MLAEHCLRLPFEFEPLTEREAGESMVVPVPRKLAPDVAFVGGQDGTWIEVIRG